jgi:hypothetical protein
MRRKNLFTKAETPVAARHDPARLSRLSEDRQGPPLRRQPNDHNFGSLIMLARTAGAFLLVTWIATKGALLPGVAHSVKRDWQNQVLAATGQSTL